MYRVHVLLGFALLRVDLAHTVQANCMDLEFPAQRPETRSFDVFFDLCPNKRLSK